MPFRSKTCEHLEDIKIIKYSNRYECAQCAETGDSWVHLRTCQECGITLCCDSSPNKHASNHAKSHEHPVISSAEPNENRMWCYEDNLIKKY